MAYVAIADRDNEQELHDPDTFITKYVWSQDSWRFRMHLRLSIPPLITSLLRCTA
jgi:hypothetical protein